MVYLKLQGPFWNIYQKTDKPLLQSFTNFTVVYNICEQVDIRRGEFKAH